MNSSKKILKRILIITLSLLVLLIALHLYYINTMTGKEIYPEDSFLSTITNKKALIITAHGDDDCGMAGTIAKLTSEGWDIKHVCIADDNVERTESYVKATAELKLAGVEFFQMLHRNDLDSNKTTWMPFPKEDFAKVFNTDTFRSAIATLIDKHKPEIIFSMDNILGGYGNPDHVFISQLVLDVCEAKKNDPGFSVKKIYQEVFAPSMSESIMVKNSRSYNKDNPYLVAKKVYKCDGMPLPDVEVNVSKWGSQKKAYFSAFGPEDLKNLKKFYRYFHWYPSWVYFRIFNKEYFHIIDINKL
jgi:LmbE family N-acetylglucosaminyl deacetylase